VRRVAIAFALSLLGACHRAPARHDTPGPPVDPRSYDAFYLWPGVTPPRDTHPRLLYLLDGEVRRGGAVRFDRLRWGVPQLSGTPVWLVVRVDRLDWDAGTYAALFGELGRWQRAGNTVLGLQIDFDAATKGIGGYRQFLAGLRARLPAQWHLSITGLMDWSAHGDPHELLALRRVVDEVVVQTYQGRATIPGYGDYFRQMREFPIPFRVALVQGGTWAPPPDLRREPAFKGYVVFLLHRRDAR
jgi:hypothetical protein